jgi:allantoinase
LSPIDGDLLSACRSARSLGAALGPVSPQPDVLNCSWRGYGNRVGAWRCLELFDNLRLPAAAILNAALYEHCPSFGGEH